MDDEADTLSNLCTDLVSLRRYESALVELFRDRPAGSWTSVRELYARVADPGVTIKPELAVAGLPAPGDDRDYAVVLFFDDETKWALTAEYNVARLLNQRQPPVTAAG